MNIVKELRKKAGIQQKELAIIVGASRPTVSEWESNKKDPSGPRLKKLAEYFGVDELVILGKGVVDLSADEHALHDMPEEKLDQQLVDLLVNLSPDEVQRVQDFVAGMKAKHKE